MSTKFRSVDEAKAFAALGAGVDPKTFEEVVVPSDKDVNKSLKKHVKASKKEKELFLSNVADYRKNNKRFKGKNAKGVDINILIGPFRDGFDCFICDESGKGMRL